MLSVGKLAPGNGAADYFCREVAADPLSYYIGAGEAPGRWAGSLAPALGLEGVVHADTLQALLDGVDPRTGARLVGGRRRGRHHPAPIESFTGWWSTTETAARLGVSVRHVRRLLARACSLLEARNTGTERRPRWMISAASVLAHLAAHPPASVARRPGFDLAFRPPKSVSIVWALAPEGIAAQVRAAHASAVDAGLAYLENAACAARVGEARERVAAGGFVAARFDHRTSRAGDPLLHTHLVVANLTQTPDGQWRALDSRALYWHARAAGHLYQAQLRAEITRRLGLRWGAVTNGWADLTAIPRVLIDTFSKRRAEIAAAVAAGGGDSARAWQAATLATRTPKNHAPAATAAGLHERWAVEALEAGFDPARLDLTRRATPPTLDAVSVVEAAAGPDGVTRLASTFDRRDAICVTAELAPDADAATVTDLADRLLADRHHVVPLAARTPAGTLRYTTPELLALEADLIAWATDPTATGPSAPLDAVAAACAAHPHLSPEQHAMVRAVASSPAAVRVVAGRPGSGKTAALACALDALRAAGIPTIGAALSATAAAQLEDAARFAQRTGRAATTLARLAADLNARRVPTGAVIVIDEATMAPTRLLARIATHARATASAVVLVGDPDQHGAVEAGGLFAHLAHHPAATVATLEENRRQRDPRERAAITAYRAGNVAPALSTYDQEGRLTRSPDAATSHAATALAWHHARTAGKDAVMVAGSHYTRRALNDAARHHLTTDHSLGAAALTVGGREYRVGDLVVARRNHPHLAGDRGETLKNASRGTITALHPDTREVTAAFTREGTLRVPRWYLEGGHLEHGYALTTYAAQGATVGTALYHPTDTATFEEGYVAVTRARNQTHLFVVDGPRHDPDTIDLEAHATETDVTNLEHVTAALTRRRASALATDTDPTASATLPHLHLTDTALNARLTELDQDLADPPANPTTQLRNLERRLGHLHNRARQPAHRRRRATIEQTIRDLEDQRRDLLDVAERHAQWNAAHRDAIVERRALRGLRVARRLHDTDTARTGPVSEAVADHGLTL